MPANVMIESGGLSGLSGDLSGLGAMSMTTNQSKALTVGGALGLSLGVIAFASGYKGAGTVLSIAGVGALAVSMMRKQHRYGAPAVSATAAANAEALRYAQRDVNMEAATKGMLDPTEAIRFQVGTTSMQAYA